jgi:hypothetical protein
MARTDVRDFDLSLLAPFLSSLTHLDLNGCTAITLLPNYLKSPWLNMAKYDPQGLDPPQFEFECS